MIEAMSEHQFVLWVIGAESKNRGNFKYTLPANVTEIREVFLDDALQVPTETVQGVTFTKEETEAHKELISCDSPDWNVLFRCYNTKQTSVHSYLMSEHFLELLLNMAHEKYPYIAFAELFHTQRSMLVPLLHLLRQEIPEADVYHATSTGYGGILGAMAGSIKKRPFVLTEHGIYTREREEELLRASWIPSYFRQHWISFFYMLAHCAYDNAISVTSLFGRSLEVQKQIGDIPQYKLKVIQNGIHYQRFVDIPPKPADNYIDIGAIVRFHPIKDIKTMIYSFFELKLRIPNARLHILGDADDDQYYEECQTLIKQLKVKDVIIAGNVNVTDYLKQLDFTILTSISEGQPLSVLESFAAARPCVTTDVGCCRELLDGTGIDSFGRAGLCVPPMHSQAFANAMEYMCKKKTNALKWGKSAEKGFLHPFCMTIWSRIMRIIIWRY
jgi:Glycosyltransferase